MLPVVVYEGLIHSFKFYHDGSVRQGMSYRFKLYKLVEVFTAEQRVQAYSLGCHLSNSGSNTVITALGQHYKVWTEIRSSAEPKALTVHSNTARTARTAAPLQVAY